MPETPEHKREFTWVVRTARTAVVVTLIVLALVVAGSVAMIVASASQGFETGQWGPLLRYALWFAGSLVAAIWVLLIYGVIHAIVANQTAVSDSEAQLGRIETLLSDEAHSIRRLINLSSLSDRTKGLIYRDREIEAINEAVHDEVMRQDYGAAEATIQMMEQQLGYSEEAQRLREEVEEARKATLEEKIAGAVSRVEKIIETRDWTRATRAVEKLVAQFPENPRITSLPQRVEDERNNHKRQLLEEYGEAVSKNDVNRGIDLLKELDRYLTPQEAAALEESARGVFKAKLHNLGVQFAICVTDQRWAEALATGEEIVRGFPNSRMSHEVRQKIPLLRERVAEGEGASAS